MTTYILLLRAINVGGHNKIKMADLTVGLESMGLTDIQTYIQSGNVIFKANSTDKNALRLQIEKLIAVKFDLTIQTFLLTINEWQKIVNENPFQNLANFEAEKLYITLFSDKIEMHPSHTLKSSELGADQILFKNNIAYLYVSTKYSDTKLSNSFLEKTFKIKATSRNWKTTLALLERGNNQ